jgi:hypothetical protein
MHCGRLSASVQALSLVILLVGCDSERARTPLSPTPTPVTPSPTPVVLAGTISGVVFEMTASGRVPVENVEVYCDSCGPEGHTFSYSRSDGGYDLPRAPAGTNLLLVAKEGYTLLRPDWTSPSPTPSGWLGGVNASVNGDTRFDIELARR